MIISGRRIKNVTRHLGYVDEGAEVILGLVELARFAPRLQQIGFSDHPVDGETILPRPCCGPLSRYNADGRYIVHRDRPMETAYRQVEWHWTEWHGRDSVEQTGIRDVPYQRYPRSFDPPPSVEMTLSTREDGSPVLVTPPIALRPENHKAILHTVNLFLEIFGECEVMNHDLHNLGHPQIRRVHWTILPRGRMPWDQLHEQLRPIIDRQPPGKQPIILHRLEAVNAHRPPFVAIGYGGFEGYVIFGFPERHMFILECMRVGNATYIFGDDWEVLSQLTKADILSENRQLDRLIHREGWDERLEGLFTDLKASV